MCLYSDITNTNWKVIEMFFMQPFFVNMKKKPAFLFFFKSFFWSVSILLSLRNEMTEMINVQREKSILAPSRVWSGLSPWSVFWVAGHRSRVLGETGASFRNGIEASFSHWGALPHASAPFFLGTLKAASTTTV